VLSLADRTLARSLSYKATEARGLSTSTSFGLLLLRASAFVAESAPTLYDREESRTVLTSLVTEVHVSDENRDFMSSTHVDSKSSRRNAPSAVRVDDENENAEEPVELPRFRNRSVRQTLTE